MAGSGSRNSDIIESREATQSPRQRSGYQLSPTEATRWPRQCSRSSLLLSVLVDTKRGYLRRYEAARVWSGIVKEQYICFRAAIIQGVHYN